MIRRDSVPLRTTLCFQSDYKLHVLVIGFIKRSVEKVTK